MNAISILKTTVPGPLKMRPGKKQTHQQRENSPERKRGGKWGRKIPRVVKGGEGQRERQKGREGETREKEK